MAREYQKVAVHGLIEKDGKFVVLHRSSLNDYMADYWDIPGGTVEFGENHIEALEREILEETGIKAKVEKPLFVHSFMSGPERHQFQIIYSCKYIEGEIELNPEEHDQYLLASFDEMGTLKKIDFLEAFLKDFSK